MSCLSGAVPMGELMKQLEAKGSYLQRGNPCFITQIRDNEGDDRARDVWTVVVAKGYPTSVKLGLLSDNGYKISEQTVRRHVRSGCVGCASWLS